MGGEEFNPVVVVFVCFLIGWTLMDHFLIDEGEP